MYTRLNTNISYTQRVIALATNSTSLPVLPSYFVKFVYDPKFNYVLIYVAITKCNCLIII